MKNPPRGKAAAAVAALASLIAAPVAAEVAAEQEGGRKLRRASAAAVVACEDFLLQAIAAPGSTIRPGSYVRQGIDVGWVEDDAAVVIDFSVVYAHGAGAAAMNVACLYHVEDRRIVGARVAMGYRTFRVP
jgi:hypothetical protein